MDFYSDSTGPGLFLSSWTRMMAELSAPSFSLGLDLHDLDGLDYQTLGPAPPPPPLKRLRRGPRTPTPEVVTVLDDEEDEDEIAVSSSPEEVWLRRGQFERCSMAGSHGSFSSSKFSLHGGGILTSQSATKGKGLKASSICPNSSSSTASIWEGNGKKRMFRNLTISPIGKVYLLESDLDYPFDEGKNSEIKEASPSQQSNWVTPANRNKNKEAILKSNEDHEHSLWRDLETKRNVTVPTPPLDEFSEEYLSSKKDREPQGKRREETRFVDQVDFVTTVGGYRQPAINNRSAEHKCNSRGPQPPAYKYFYHDDEIVRALVRERLPHFIPLGPDNYGEVKQSGTASLDSVNEFEPEESASNWVTPANRNKNKEAILKSNEDLEHSLWRDLEAKKNVTVPTLPSDEFSEECLCSKKDREPQGKRREETSFCTSRFVGQIDFVSTVGGYHQPAINNRSAEHECNSRGPQPPAYKYFYHDDERIRTLVRERLPHFIPLGPDNYGEVKQSSTARLDSVNEFEPEESASAGWINPRAKASAPANIEKRFMLPKVVKN